MRVMLTLFVLMNYLTGLLLVNLLLNKPVYSVTNPYVHSETCQQHNYLALDCFDKCNGDNFWKKASKDSPEQEVIFILAVHLQTRVFHLETIAFSVSSNQEFPAKKKLSISGFASQIFPPPKIG